MTRTRKTIAIISGTIALLIVLFFIVLATFDWNRLPNALFVTFCASGQKIMERCFNMVDPAGCPAQTTVNFDSISGQHRVNHIKTSFHYFLT
jgi:hypothetical protein